MAQTITEIARNTENAQRITANAVSEVQSASAKELRQMIGRFKV